MSNDLFGIDIAGIIGDNISDDDVMPATLKRRVEGESNEEDLTAPPSDTFPEFPCRGYTESISINDRTTSNVLEDDRKISIIGASLPTGVVPTQGDILVIQDDGVDVVFQVLGLINRDPAGAIYSIHARQ